MLRELSFRNARRQSRDYSLYFLTLSCTVSFMYAFNSLIFSDNVRALPNIDLLPYLIVASSLLIVLIMGWIIAYMTNYILKKRSRELSIYMLSGIPNRSISTLILYESLLIGLFAFSLGLPVGMLLSQLLEAVLMHMFGILFTLQFRFSPSAAGLTFLYFLAMVLYSARRNGRWICKVRLYDLLSFDRRTKKSGIRQNDRNGHISFLHYTWMCRSSAHLLPTSWNRL